jgi:putative transposase
MGLTCSDAEESQAALWDYEAAFHYVQLLSAIGVFDDGAGSECVPYRFVIVGYVVMPEHVHLLIGESKKANPSVVVQVLKQRVSRRLRRRSRGKSSAGQLSLWTDATVHRSFWQRRFYDFNVWSRKKRIEKLNYMHMNPVKRGLVADAKL